MSYLLDALNKSNHTQANLNQPGPNPTGQPSTGQQSTGQHSGPTHYAQQPPAMAYYGNAFQSDDDTNIYKWISIVLALILTLIVGIFVGIKYFASPAPVVSAPIVQAPTPAPLSSTQLTSAPVTANPTSLAAVSQPAANSAPVATPVPPTSQATRTQQDPLALQANHNGSVEQSADRQNPNPQNRDPQNPAAEQNSNKNKGVGNISNDLLARFSKAVKRSEDIEDEMNMIEEIRKNEAKAAQFYNYVSTIEDLAPEVRVQIPSLLYETHIFSTDPEQRWVKINGQTLQELQWVTDNIQILEIQQNYLVMELIHSRFSLPALTDYLAQ